jgi:hypothetical protein
VAAAGVTGAEDQDGWFHFWFFIWRKGLVPISGGHKLRPSI